MRPYFSSKKKFSIYWTWINRLAILTIKVSKVSLFQICISYSYCFCCVSVVADVVVVIVGAVVESFLQTFWSKQMFCKEWWIWSDKLENLQCVYRFPSLLTGKLSFCSFLVIWIGKRADKKSANNEGRLYLFGVKKHMFIYFRSPNDYNLVGMSFS